MAEMDDLPGEGIATRESSCGHGQDRVEAEHSGRLWRRRGSGRSVDGHQRVPARFHASGRPSR